MSDEMSGRIRDSRILLVEDEDSMAKGLEFNLMQEGFAVVRAEDGQQALDLFEAQAFDLVVLDVMLPHIDGFEVAERMRAEAPRLPILMLTARTSPEDRVKGLQIGADDYLAKPFHLDEFLLRVKGMLKRGLWYENVEPMTQLVFGPNTIDFGSLSATASGKVLRLTPLEAQLLKYLAERSERIVSRQELLEHVWNASSAVESRTVDNFIVRLRKYFEPDQSKPRYIVNVRGAGYRFLRDEPTE